MPIQDVDQQVWLPPVGQDMKTPVGAWPEGGAFGERVGGPAVWTGQQAGGQVPTQNWSPPPSSGAENFDPEPGK